MSQLQPSSFCAPSTAFLLVSCFFPHNGNAQAVAPVPADPHELASEGVQVVTAPADRLAALSLLRSAADSSVSHRPKMQPFKFQASFTANGSLTYSGTGELTELWMSGQSWRVTESLGNYSMGRIGFSGRTVDDKPVSLIPMRAQMLRNEILWETAINNAGYERIRTAVGQWNGKPVTCVLLSNETGPATQIPSRLWDENEYCMANDTQLLQIHSIVPGTYAVFGYSKSKQFHGKPMADRITIFVNGAQAIDSNFTITDPSQSDQTLLAVSPQTAMNARPSVALSDARVMTINVEGASGNTIEPVMIHLQLGPQGTPLEAEVSATANASLTQKALEIAKATNIGAGALSHAYLNVRFLPAAQ